MNSEKTIKKYIGVSAAKKVFAWIFLLGLLATLPMWTIFRKEADPESAVQFVGVSEKSGDYVYLDIVGISDFVYKYTRRHVTTTFYSAEDAEGYLYMLELSNSDYEKLTAQQEYWNRTDDNAPMPEPYRVYGQAENISTERISDFSEVWGLSTEEFVDAFGSKYIDVGASKESDSNLGWTLGSLFCGIFALILGLENRKVKKNMNYCIDLLASKGELDAAAAELAEGGASIIGDDMARATANYLFGKRTGCAVRYDDIAYCYTTVNGTNRRNLTGSFVVCTKDKSGINAADLGKRDYNLYGGQLEAAVAEHNPNALVGNTHQNAAAYKEIHKANK